MTNTTNYNLKKPAYSDTADIADINSNMEIIDGQMKTNANGVSANNDAIAKVDAGLAIIVSGDSCTQAVPAGGYAYIKNNTHGLAEGLYKNKSSSSFPTSGGTANSTVFEAVSEGIANALNSNLAKKTNGIYLTGSTSFANLDANSYPSKALDDIHSRINDLQTGFNIANSGGPAFCALLHKNSNIYYGGILIGYAMSSVIYQFSYQNGTFAIYKVVL